MAVKIGGQTETGQEIEEESNTVDQLLEQDGRDEFILADSAEQLSGGQQVYADPSGLRYVDGNEQGIPANAASANDIEAVKEEAGLENPLLVLGDGLEDILDRNSDGINSYIGYETQEETEPDYEKPENQWWNDDRHKDENGDFQVHSAIAAELSSADIGGVVIREGYSGAEELADELGHNGFYRISLEDGDYLISR